MNFNFPESIEDFSKIIKDTPRESKENVDAYHCRIIQLIDYSNLFKIPSMEHRNLHQQIWLSAFMVFNNYPNFNEAFLSFMKEEGRGYRGKFESQRNRFNVWYDGKYIQPFLNSSEYKWIMKIHEEDERLSKEVLHTSLDDAFLEI